MAKAYLEDLADDIINFDEDTSAIISNLRKYHRDLQMAAAIADEVGDWLEGGGTFNPRIRQMLAEISELIQSNPRLGTEPKQEIQ